MKRLAIVLEGEPRFWLPRISELFPSLRYILDKAELFRLPELENGFLPEARWLGLTPAQVGMESGPLVLAAFGVDPPERSWQFEVSLLGLDDKKLIASEPPTPDETRQILEVLPKLNTRALTFVKGFADRHGLVYEGRMDLETTPEQKALGQALTSVLPDGDGDRVLRQFIDDSVNLLAGLEINHVREAEGKPALLVAWPFGGGIRYPVPNLWLQRGRMAKVFSSRLTTLGLTRLVGYERQYLPLFKLPTEPKDGSQTVWAWEDVPQGTEEERLIYFGRHVNEVLLEPAIGDPNLQSLALVVAPSLTSEGLALAYEPHLLAKNTFPFDDRALEERRVPRVDLAKWMDSWYSAASLPGSSFGSL